MTKDACRSRSGLEQLETVFDDMFDAVFIVYVSNGEVVYANRAMCAMYGYPPSEALQLTIRELCAGESCESVAVAMDSLSTTARGSGQFFEWKARKKDGTHFWAETSMQKADVAGEDLVIALVRDITGRKLAEEELKRQKRLLQELNETLEKRVTEEVAKNREKDIMLIQQHRQAALGEMLDHIVHQWKQPLNSLSLIIQCLGETASDGELTNAYVEETVGKTMALLDHMAQTVNFFSGFYRQDKEKKVFCIKGSIDQALAFVAPAFRFHSIAVELDVDPGLTVFGCPKEYAQVLLNILANARDAFKARGTENARVIIRAFAEDTKTVVTIADNAGGIPEAIMGRIFDFYFTTNESNGGTGIGLYMSKNIIEKNMGGTLSALNTDGGAQFRIEVNLS